MSDKLIVLDLNNVLIYPIYPSIEMPTYDDVMKGDKILDGEVLIRSRNHIKLFLDFLFENYKVGIWSNSKSTEYINEILKMLKIKDKVEFIYTEKDYEKRYREVCGFGYEIQMVKSTSKIKKFDQEDIIFIESKKSKIFCDSHTINIKRFYSQSDDTLLKLIDFLTVLKQLKNMGDYKGDIEYYQLPF